MDPLSIVSLIFEVITAVDKVIEGFERIQNAPKEIRDFRGAVVRLERNYRLLCDLQSHRQQPSASCLSQDDTEAIEETLLLCDALFRNHMSLQGNNQGILNSVLRSTWPVRNSQKLARYKDSINQHYATIITPTFLNMIANVQRPVPEPSQSRQQEQQQQSLTTGVLSTLAQDLDVTRVNDFVQGRLASDNRQMTEKVLRELDQSLQKCWAKLGLQDDDIFDHAGLTTGRRPSTMEDAEYQNTPATLEINGAAPNHRYLRLQRVHIMARDDESRILLYQNEDADIKVTHIVPRGSIPFTIDKKSTRISFLKPAHVITVVDDEGHHLYNISPKYQFENLDTCVKFQQTLREREHGGAFDAAQITEGHDTLALLQVVRFWRRELPNSADLVTLTFLQSALEPKRYREIDVSDYFKKAEYHKSWNRLAPSSDTIDITPRDARTKTMQFRFKSNREASAFKRCFEDMYTHTRVVSLHPPRIPAIRPTSSILLTSSEVLLEPAMRMRPTAIDTDNPHSPYPDPNVSLAAPSVTPSTMTAISEPPSSIFTLTSTSALSSPWTTPHQTPSDQNWNLQSTPRVPVELDLDDGQVYDERRQMTRAQAALDSYVEESNRGGGGYMS